MRPRCRSSTRPRGLLVRPDPLSPGEAQRLRGLRPAGPAPRLRVEPGRVQRRGSAVGTVMVCRQVVSLGRRPYAGRTVTCTSRCRPSPSSWTARSASSNAGDQGCGDDSHPASNTTTRAAIPRNAPTSAVSTYQSARRMRLPLAERRITAPTAEGRGLHTHPHVDACPMFLYSGSAMSLTTAGLRGLREYRASGMADPTGSLPMMVHAWSTRTDQRRDRAGSR
jgi:hypothetical protein